MDVRGETSWVSTCQFSRKNFRTIWEGYTIIGDVQYKLRPVEVVNISMTKAENEKDMKGPG